ncbi:ABC transporter permease [Sphingomonas sanguinis]|uniref:ABC transporter permease n=1 Tax=Sphingomonas sanguinis TaxID=33051 RepID=A0ABU5LSY0_9SPHN|nr:ABC transporter permease [Sphingomonas sanguinis]MDZ7282861.1 ABC transporter permease [Sphingomonas sanguinis]QXT35632.1 ABC transporter permease [Sphingomonas sanguinis]
MNSFALLSLYRSLTRHKLYAALNIGGLAVGIAVFFVLGLYVRFETSFERWLPHHDQIYLVQNDWKRSDGPYFGKLPDSMGGLLDEMLQDFPGLVGTRYMGGEEGGSVMRGGIAQLEDVAQVDASFFQVFDLPMVAGDKATALADPSSVVISRSAARRFFGDADPIGRTLTLMLDDKSTRRVTGVFEDLPKTTDFRFSILTRLSTYHPEEWWTRWGSGSVLTYLRFPDEAAARAFENRIPGFIDRRGARDLGPNAASKFGLPLLPITRVHLEPANGESGGRKQTVVTLGVVGVLTLLIAVVNYINLASARAGLRAREVAMRKVLGADRATLIRQFLGEAILAVGVAGLLGLILAEIGLPLVNAAGGLSLAMPYAIVVPVLLLVSLVVGTAAGFYPAVLLSGFPAASVLASARTPGGGRAGARAREALVVFQFTLVIAFLIGTGVLVAQTRHLRTADLGFRRDGMLILPWVSYVDAAKRPALIAAFKAVPGVTMVATADTAMGRLGNNNAANVAVPGRPGPGPSLRQINVGSDFFGLYGPRLLAGRFFDDAHRTDDGTDRKRGDPRNIVINREAVTALGFASPEQAIGKTVGQEHPLTIIGVIDALRFFSPRTPPQPTYYYYTRGIVRWPSVTIRFIGDPRTVMNAVRAAWQRVAPEAPFKGDTSVQLLQSYYDADERATRLFGIGAGLAVLIGCVGLWGLASFNTARRVKEIGIRKVLGASSADIVRLLVGQFLRPVLIANVIAWPLAFVAMRTWLAGFDDRISLSPLFFVGASLLAIVIAVLTVLGQSLRASRATPAWALRHD